MSEKKDEFKEWVVSTFDEEAEQELRRLQEKEDELQVPDGVKEAVFARLQEQLKERNERDAHRQSAEEDDDIISQLSPEDRKALELGRKMMKAEIGQDEKDSKKPRRRKKPVKIYLVLAAVLICVMAMGITSVGGPERVVRMVRQAVGDRDVEKLSRSNKIKDASNEEESAYENINNIYDTDIVRLPAALEGIKFDSMELDKKKQVAEFYYEYKNETLVYFINFLYGDGTWGISIEDKLEERYKKSIKGCDIAISIYKIQNSNKHRCAASFQYDNKEYFLTGTMEQQDFEKILKNLFFPK